MRSHCPSCSAIFLTPYSRCPLDGAELVPLGEDPMTGRVLDKRYQIEACIGEGGMGRVYRAKHTRMSRMYAIKVLFGDHASDPRMRSRFAREAEAVSRLTHANVISVVDFGETPENLLYLVMDLANGRPLSDLVTEQAPMDPHRCLQLLSQLAAGLAHAHNHGLVHRDFKCENVIVVMEDGQEVPKIVDFGICKIVESAADNTMLTSHGQVMGTPAMMAPEQACGGDVDHRTDLFSLGLVAFQMLTGRLPFDGTPIEIAQQNLSATMPSMFERSGISVPQQLEHIVATLTQKNPDERFQSAKAVLIAMQGDLSGPIAMDPQRAAFASDQWATAPMAHPVGQGGLSTSGTNHLTLLVGPSPTAEISQQRRPFLTWKQLGIGAVLMAAIALLLVTFLPQSAPGDSSVPAQLETASAVREVAPAVEMAVVVEPDPAVALEQDAATAPLAIPPAADIEPAENVVAAAATTDTQDEAKIPVTSERATGSRISQRERRRRAMAKRRDQQLKRKQASTPPVKPLKTADTEDAAGVAQKIKKTRELYRKVAAELDILERQQGKAAVQSLRRFYGTVSVSRLLRDPTMQVEYQKTLQLLLTKIRKKRRNSR